MKLMRRLSVNLSKLRIIMLHDYDFELDNNTRTGSKSSFNFQKQNLLLFKRDYTMVQCIGMKTTIVPMITKKSLSLQEPHHENEDRTFFIL